MKKFLDQNGLSHFLEMLKTRFISSSNEGTTGQILSKTESGSNWIDFPIMNVIISIDATNSTEDNIVFSSNYNAKEIYMAKEAGTMIRVTLLMEPTFSGDIVALDYIETAKIDGDPIGYAVTMVFDATSTMTTTIGIYLQYFDDGRAELLVEQLPISSMIYAKDVSYNDDEYWSQYMTGHSTCFNVQDAIDILVHQKAPSIPGIYLLYDKATGNKSYNIPNTFRITDFWSLVDRSPNIFTALGIYNNGTFETVYYNNSGTILSFDFSNHVLNYTAIFDTYKVDITVTSGDAMHTPSVAFQVSQITTSASTITFSSESTNLVSDNVEAAIKEVNAKIEYKFVIQSTEPETVPEGQIIGVYE